MDAKWLELLKASGWQLGALSLSLAAFWALIKFGVLPAIDMPLIVYGLPLAVLVTGFLALFGAAEQGAGVLAEKRRKAVAERDQQKKLQNQKDELAAYLPFLTDREKRILGYLLHNSQKTFTAHIDGDLAASLYNRGFVKLLAKPGQHVSQIHASFGVPDHLWEVLEANKKCFPKDLKQPVGRSRPWHSGMI
ncbi:hypothetical protein OU426_04835 [Frigidibacter sp. RF13]|uniref:hypothetical protein n=1 Tax=Frigidibacter sp. RF13 TaxID=2997340 RepID=UPI002271245C|nr:hypothetical protein [Frigidibacter sp. RF13]MCY1126172.1 hypothetical protein [Frigidibacter sp. RF13]